MRTGGAGLACAVAIGVATIAGQPPAFQTTVDIVAVDLTVLGRDGRPVADLTPADHSVLVDGTPRSIASLTYWQYGQVSERSPADAAPAAPPAAPTTGAPVVPPPDRTFVIVVDHESLPAGKGQQTLRAARTFIEQLDSRDRVALWTIPETSSTLSFNEDRKGSSTGSCAWAAPCAQASATTRSRLAKSLPSKKATAPCWARSSRASARG